MAEYNSDRTGANIDAVLDKADNLTQAAVGVGGNVGIGTANPSAPLSLNRTVSDGTILDFSKDGATVGSIRSRSGAVSTIILDPRAGGSGLTGTEGGIYPVNNEGSAADGLINLGLSNQRFKDLHLSGGVYLGGTGAVNKLDDYEEGTFTPSITFGGGSTGLTFLLNNGQYTKIGRLVYVRMSFRFDSKGSSTGNALITGLPFTAISTAGGFSNQALGLISQAGFSGLSDNVYATANENSTNAGIFHGSNVAAPLNDTNFVGTSSNYFTITGCYVTA